MTVPLYIFLIIYLLLVLVVLWFFLATFYHLVRFGTLNFATVFVPLIFVIGMFLLIYYSYQYLSTINWQDTITIFKEIHLEKPEFNLPINSNF